MSTFTVYDAAYALNKCLAENLPRMDAVSRRKLLKKSSKKVVEEAAEALAEAMDMPKSRELFIAESADVLLRFLALLAICGVPLELVEAGLAERVEAFILKEFPEQKAGSP